MGLKLTMLTYEDVESRLNWGETNELEFKPEPNNGRSFVEYIFETVLAMSNMEGGTLVIGVKEEKVSNRTSRSIAGVTRSATDISDKLMQLVNEYVEPKGLRYSVYPIESSSGGPPLVGIDVEKIPGEQFAVRHDGIASQKITSYNFFLRLNGETRKVNFPLFLTTIRGNLVKEMTTLAGEASKHAGLGVQVQIAGWRKRQPSTAFTTVFALLRFDNKGEAYTRVHTAKLSFEFKGQKYEAVPSQTINVTVMAGTSTAKNLLFDIPIETEIGDTIEKAILKIVHTHGEKQIEIGDIRQKG